MALTVTKYSAVATNTNGADTDVYTVGAGKVAKVKFNAGLVPTKDHDDLVYASTTYGSSKGVCTNAAGVYAATDDSKLTVGGIQLIGSGKSSGSNDIFVSNMYFIGDDIMTVLEINPAVDVAYTDTAILASKSIRLKNEFILVAGETVTINTSGSATSVTFINYDFTVFEEDI